jgi:hypothetical protein
MTPQPPPDPLAPALQSWRVDPPADPGFRAAVWRRIEAATPPTWGAYLRRHAVAWSCAAALAVVAAGWTGHRVAQVRLAAERERMVATYLGDLDPRVIVATTPPSP